MPVYLIRHGQSEFNAAYDIDGKDPRILDAPLSAKGVEQAKSTREKVKNLGIQHVIASPLTRALQTATHIFGGTHDIKVNAEVREQLSHSCDIGRSNAELQADFPDLDFDHLPEVWWHTGTLNDQGYTVETVDVHQARVDSFIRNLAAITPRPVALVGHGNTFKAMTGIKMENCQVLLFDGKSSAVSV